MAPCLFACSLGAPDRSRTALFFLLWPGLCILKVSTWGLPRHIIAFGKLSCSQNAERMPHTRAGNIEANPSHKNPGITKNSRLSRCRLERHQSIADCRRQSGWLAHNLRCSTQYGNRVANQDIKTANKKNDMTGTVSSKASPGKR